jgi:hypothetical protein
MKACEEDTLMGHLGVVLYEYLGEEVSCYHYYCNYYCNNTHCNIAFIFVLWCQHTLISSGCSAINSSTY